MSHEGDSHKPGGRLPLLSARPAVTKFFGRLQEVWKNKHIKLPINVRFCSKNCYSTNTYS